ncbi:MAG: hypothetical protein L0Y71_05990 [Gemmataceae bacterium]|nr:hypothetical protein [Gemmataceae bacterium]
MPRIVVQQTPRSPRFEGFVRRLTQELKSPSPGPQPLILEEEVSSTRSRHVRVIWDQWKKLREEERTDVILEAYKQAEGKDFADQITIASGLTGPEALALGLLPWTVEPILSRRDGYSIEDYGRAISEEEKRSVLGVGSAKKYGHLRYARKEDAEDAIRRLRTSLPKSSWTIAQDVYAE